MKNRGTFEVQHVRTRRGVAMAASAGYASGPGDPRRQGVANPQRATPPGVVVFVDCAAGIEARLGGVTVGAVTPDSASGGFVWSVDLAQMSRVPKRALSVDKAKDAVAHKVREWCEAARMVSARRDGGAR